MKIDELNDWKRQPPTLKVGALCLRDVSRRPFDQVSLVDPDLESADHQERHLCLSGRPISVLGPSERLFQLAANDQVSNAEFVSEVFDHLPHGAFAVGCRQMRLLPGDGDLVWVASELEPLLTETGEVFVPGCSYRLSADGGFRLDRDHFAALHFVVVDDIGGRNAIERFAGLEFSWLDEVGPGVIQAGIVFDKPIDDADQASALLRAAIDAGICHEGGAVPPKHWARLPGKHGEMIEWNPGQRWSLTFFSDVFGLDLNRQRSDDDAQSIEAEATSPNSGTPPAPCGSTSRSAVPMAYDGRLLLNHLGCHSDIDQLLTSARQLEESFCGRETVGFNIRERPDRYPAEADTDSCGAYALSAMFDLDEVTWTAAEVEQRLARFCALCEVPEPTHVVMGVGDRYCSAYWCVDRYIEPSDWNCWSRMLFDFLCKAGMMTIETASTCDIDLGRMHRIPEIFGVAGQRNCPRLVRAREPLSADQLRAALERYYDRAWPKTWPTEWWPMD